MHNVFMSLPADVLSNMANVVIITIYFIFHYLFSFVFLRHVLSSYCMLKLKLLKKKKKNMANVVNLPPKA